MDHARRDTVHSNTEFGIFHRKRFGKFNNSRLTCRVIGISGKSDLARNGAKIDDAAVFPFCHMRDHQLETVDHTIKIDIDDPPDLLNIHLFKALAARHIAMIPDTRIIDKDVDLAEIGDDLSK